MDDTPDLAAIRERANRFIPPESVVGLPREALVSDIASLHEDVLALLVAYDAQAARLAAVEQERDDAATKDSAHLFQIVSLASDLRLAVDRLTAAEARATQYQAAMERMHRALARLNTHHTENHHAGDRGMPLDPIVADGFVAYRFPDGRLALGAMAALMAALPGEQELEKR